MASVSLAGGEPDEFFILACCAPPALREEPHKTGTKHQQHTRSDHNSHYSHISIEQTEQARDRNIYILRLPPNTTHTATGGCSQKKLTQDSLTIPYWLHTDGKSMKETFPRLLAEGWG